MYQKKERLNQIRNEKLEDVILRSRSGYEDLGQKSTNYSFKLERLVDDDDTEYYTEEILNYQRIFIQIYIIYIM